MPCAIEQSDKLPVIFERLKQGTTDVLLLDLSCPCNPGIGMIEQLRAQGKNVAIVTLIPPDKEELARASLRAGVQEYLGRETLNGADLARAAGTEGALRLRLRQRIHRLPGRIGNRPGLPAKTVRHERARGKSAQTSRRSRKVTVRLLR
jgi:DNA-binding NarL/FixJ family response regulator